VIFRQVSAGSGREKQLEDKNSVLKQGDEVENKKQECVVKMLFIRALVTLPTASAA